MTDTERAIKVEKTDLAFFRRMLREENNTTFLSAEQEYVKGRNETCRKLKEAIEAHEFVISMLSRQNPKPLTLDELRERDGKPVWVITINKKSWESEISGWALAVYDYVDRIYVAGYGHIPFLADYGKTWLAYDHEIGEQHEND